MPLCSSSPLVRCTWRAISGPPSYDMPRTGPSREDSRSSAARPERGTACRARGRRTGAASGPDRGSRAGPPRGRSSTRTRPGRRSRPSARHWPPAPRRRATRSPAEPLRPVRGGGFTAAAPLESPPKGTRALSLVVRVGSGLASALQHIESTCAHQKSQCPAPASSGTAAADGTGISRTDQHTRRFL